MSNLSFGDAYLKVGTVEKGSTLTGACEVQDSLLKFKSPEIIAKKPPYSYLLLFLLLFKMGSLLIFHTTIKCRLFGHRDSDQSR